jgi:hypothetical protein
MWKYAKPANTKQKSSMICQETNSQMKHAILLSHGNKILGSANSIQEFALKEFFLNIELILH